MYRACSSLCNCSGIPGKDIRQLDFPALKRAGYRGAIFDKDNCLTLPHKDELVPELKYAWQECRETFGEGNVIVVSNSAGTHLDAGGIQAESVSYHLNVPVLIHSTMKPSYSCIAAIRKYYTSLPSPVEDKELIIVGDRLFTDVVLANRIRSWKGWRSFLGLDREPPSAKGGPLAVWTTGVWQKEATVLRWSEKQMLALVQRWSRPSPGTETQLDVGSFIRKLPKQEKEVKNSGLERLLTKFEGLNLGTSTVLMPPFSATLVRIPSSKRSTVGAMHYVKTTTSYHSDSPLPTPGPSLSENRPAGHRPKSLALTTTTAPDEPQRPPQPEFRPYGRGGAGRRPRVKPNNSELDPKDKPKLPTFKFPAKWRPKVIASEQTSPARPGFYDGPWCGPSQSAPSLPSSSSRRTPSPMFTQRDLFLASLWKKNSKKMRASNADSLSVTCSTSSTFSGHSSSASGSSLASLSHPDEGDDSGSEVYTESFETPSSAPHSLKEVTICQSDTGAGSESTGLEGGLSTTEITVVGMGDECDLLDAMRKLRMNYTGTMKRFRPPDVSSLITSTFNATATPSDPHSVYVVDQAEYQAKYRRLFRPLTKSWQTGTGTGSHPLRSLAHREGALAMGKFRLSNVAQQARNRTDMAMHKNDAYEHLGNMQRYNAAAAHSIFTENNAKRVPFSYDLHGLHAHEATFFAERIIKDAIAHRDPYVWLICGRHSHVRIGLKGKSVMAAIEEQLQKKALKWEMINGGFKVILDNPLTSPDESNPSGYSRAPPSAKPSKTHPTPVAA
ncbi:mitochondrial PGP phosphatase-domain-containing protein [Armillaria novae-zelandiae]|uniref:Mitochondrial PGP phosphatase-domain-containing protein n=1 Tax=Armillaria novae-zelandiae TaxID=153914 RepID=A0AA39UNP0_9AGAR|nr:mitochondrial PGP phosphatase-domain-containing protein [Armillaria novae-zelandiae]